MENKYEEFLGMLRDDVPFSFARYGDGEWSAICKTEPETRGNTDGHLYFPDMGDALANVLKSKPKYYLGMQRMALEDTHPEHIKKFIADNHLEDIQWVNADCWHHASIKDNFQPFFKTIEKKVVLLVGPAYLRPMVMSCYQYHIDVPEKNCWLEKDRIVNGVKKFVDGTVGPIVVLFVASMPANVMIHELYEYYGDQHTFIDMGSVFDPYLKKKTRSYHKKVIERIHGSDIV